MSNPSSQKSNCHERYWSMFNQETFTHDYSDKDWSESFLKSTILNIKNTRKGIKLILTIKNISADIPTILSVNGTTISNPTAIANVFNNYFSSIANANKHFSYYLKNEFNISFFLSPINKIETVNVISSFFIKF